MLKKDVHVPVYVAQRQNATGNIGTPHRNPLRTIGCTCIGPDDEEKRPILKPKPTT